MGEPFLRDLTVPCTAPGCGSEAIVELVLSSGHVFGWFCQRHGDRALSRLHQVRASRFN